MLRYFENASMRVKYGLFKRDREFIKRWPKNPKVVFGGAPNAFVDEFS